MQTGRISIGLTILGAMTLIGCGSGSADVENTVPETTLELNTVFGWIDTSITTIEDDRIKVEPRDEERLTIIASGATFDATDDLRFLSASKRFQLVIDNSLNGFMAVHVPDLSKLDVGASYDSDDEDAPFAYEVDFGPVELENDEDYSAEPMLGSRRRMTLTVEELGSGPGDKFEATLRYTVEKEDGDPSGVLTGTVEAKLSGPLVNERLGNCNASLFFDTDGDCD